MALISAGSTSATPSHASTGGLLGGMSEYPVQITKVQPPPLRDETLARDRLLEWLSVKIHRRAVLVIAEAGYGKTTLLADFTRRSRVRVFWYRLDRGDRDWVGFLAYLVAAIRLHHPGFGEATGSLIRETATAAPPRETVVDTFVRELGQLPPDASAFVFDDFHLVDDSPDVRYVVRELLARGPERLALVFASRRDPPLRLARLRALGEVAEIETDDLRFDAEETERLFRETYAMRLEPGLVAELTRRTEGWAASLQLVRSALHDRDPTQIRAFISSLSGAEGHLYDYLAEEVVGDLEPDLQAFLMRTSLLETIDLPLGIVAAEVSESDAARWIDEGERLGLLGKGGPNTRHVGRAHPLVRDFLQARLTRAIGEAQVRVIHHRIAVAAEALDWQTAARHYLAAADPANAGRVLTDAVEAILATGAYAAAQALASELPGGALPGAPGMLLASRLAQQRADTAEGVALAEQALAADPTSTPVLLNLVTARSLAGDVAGALDAGRRLESASGSRLAEVGRAFRAALETSVNGSIDAAFSEMLRLAPSFRQRGEQHYLGVSLLNQAILLAAAGRHQAALERSEEAIGLLGTTSAGVELVSARLARASALAYLGDIQAARAEMSVAATTAPPGQLLEIAAETAHIEALMGEAASGQQVISQVGHLVSAESDVGEFALLARSLVRIRTGDVEGARRDAAAFRHGEPRSSVAFEARRCLVEALVSHALGQLNTKALDAGISLAARQGAILWHRFGLLLKALANDQGDPSGAVQHALAEDPAVVSMLAELAVGRLPTLSSPVADGVLGEAQRRPWRWRSAARQMLAAGSSEQRLSAGRMLEEIGEASDVSLLRMASREIPDSRAASLGQVLARRLAARVMVEDLGRVRISIGPRLVEGSDIRRRVLTLLCLLLTKTTFAATRDEVVDTLWPDQDPAAALNSLNQTVYFLRRVFEPEYREDVSPGYVSQDGEMVWLDQELVQARSRHCVGLIVELTTAPTSDAALALGAEYTSRFAMDFAYEEWAAAYRESLHASYLRAIELAIRADIDSGQFARGTYLAERATEVDPEADEIQLALANLYQLAGAHAAAAEKYGQYASSMRGLGLEPVALPAVPRTPKDVASGNGGDR